MIARLLLVLLALGFGYWLLTWWCVHRFFRSRPRARPEFTPSVSILKPVKGIDAEAYENFATFCWQDYPDYELLFGVCDPADPAVAVVKRLQQCFPERSIRLIAVQAAGTNPKAAILQQLAAQSRGEVLVISDSDIRVTPDYLRRVVGPLEDRDVGAVTCLYRSESPRNLPARLEALYLDADFMPSVVVANRFFGYPVGLGATIAVRWRDLVRLGGYASIADYLTDDYQIATRIRQLGLAVRLSDYVVANVMGAGTFREQWGRAIRWARGIRVCRPLEYPGLIVTFTTPLALLLIAASGFSVLTAALLAASLLLRWTVAWSMRRHLGTPNELARSWENRSCATACPEAALDPTLLADHGTANQLGQAVSLGCAGLDNKPSQAVAHPSSTPRSVQVHLGLYADLLWLPVRDCLSALVWSVGLMGRRITWRGQVFSLLPSGRLEVT